MSTHRIECTVNGEAVDIEVPSRRLLADFLRDDLHLTGTKVGCGEGQCGTCTVLVDGQPVKSCLTQASALQGKSILTIEGLRALRPAHQQDSREDLRALHPLQEAFITHGALQCGFCTPGQLMRAYALLRENPDPSVAEIRAALDDVRYIADGRYAVRPGVFSPGHVDPGSTLLAEGQDSHLL